MSFPRNVWNQLKNLTADRLIGALEKDGWTEDVTRGATRAFIKDGQPLQRIVIHYHPRKTYQPGLLKALLADIGWDTTDLKRLKLIK